MTLKKAFSVVASIKCLTELNIHKYNVQTIFWKVFGKKISMHYIQANIVLDDDLSINQ